MKIAPVHLIWKKPRVFIPAFAPPLLGATFGLIYSCKYWPYHVAILGSAFVVTLTLIESLATGQIEDNWGRLTRRDHPQRYWVQVVVWLALYLCTIATPVVIAILWNGRPST
ncbi:MAG: hypothetical protein QM715_16775 [Nibricoccus sp.]